ncbi:hypothetical protein MNQ98_01115 [Paenibacillus sp. N3/727]|uniref:hypothetical protein n=1 Tax=Paenibacillus sp. N3/727 TaxID=2925845 RepID=UPI001F53227F|nr:hypothetical protein [Paenibacillus sp. N3/727]UNK18678.1 hypothetical protein MNQ98_01115 [Paenibacillus sp. N3/727]
MITKRNVRILLFIVVLGFAIYFTKKSLPKKEATEEAGLTGYWLGHFQNKKTSPVNEQ